MQPYQFETVENLDAVDVQSPGEEEARSEHAGEPRQVVLTPEELQALQEKNFQMGFAQGKKEGFTEGVDSIKAQTTRLGRLIESLRRQQEEVVRQGESWVLRLVFRVLEAVLGAPDVVTSKLEPKKLNSVVREALTLDANSTRLNLRLHPSVAEDLERYRAGIVEQLPEGCQLSVHPDPTLRETDCLVETDFSVLDGRVESQLRLIRAALEKEQENDGKI